jgi:hypothetical protein
MVPALTTMNRAEQEHAQAGRLAVRKIQLKNNKLPRSAALHPVISLKSSVELAATQLNVSKVV